MPCWLNFKKEAVPHVHTFILILNAANVNNEIEYIEIAFIEKNISINSPDTVEQPEVFELVKLHQIYSHSRPSLEYKKNKCQFLYGQFFYR